MPADGYEKYEQDCAKIKEENAKLLADFRQWLAEKGLVGKTLESHTHNMDFYINTFLLYEEAIPAKAGAGHVSMFLGDWFPRKAMWASRSSIKQNAASLKKFYSFMREKGEIDLGALEDMKQVIEADMDEWLEGVDGQSKGT